MDRFNLALLMLFAAIPPAIVAAGTYELTTWRPVICGVHTLADSGFKLLLSTVAFMAVKDLWLAIKEGKR